MRPITLTECVSFVAVCHLKSHKPGLHVATARNWPSEGCRDSRKIKRARLSAPSNGPLFVYTLWSRSLPFIRSLCTGRKSRGLVYVAFQGKRWPSSSWNDRCGNDGASKREMERQKKKRERKWDEIGRHFGLSVGTVPVNAFWLIVTSMAANHPQTHSTPSPAGWQLGHISWKTSHNNCACSTCHKLSNRFYLPLSMWWPKESRNVTVCAEVMCPSLKSRVEC